jgi:predicted O-methyltransferase YrrM
MMQLLKHIIKKTPLYDPLRNWKAKRKQVDELVEWERKGRPLPPPHLVKQRTLQSYARRFGLKILVETGTYYGDMVEAMKDSFDRLYSIELSKELYEKARRRFKGVEHIELIHGDSAIELRQTINRINQSALFWLDGHYSAGDTARGDKETPIYEELDHILNAPDRGHVIIIDDARCFGRDPAYPSLGELSDFIRSKRRNIDIVVQDDSIRITPKQ